jgi:soluble lytic murein transglycosylase-like protein
LAPGELQRLTNQAGAREGLAPDLLRAVIDQESAGKPCVVSPAGAQGLMQLMPATQRYFGVADPFDPEESVLAGAKLLGTLMARYAGNLPKALAAYNAGPGAVDRAGGVPPIPQTQSYVNEIMRRVTPVAPLTVR